MILHVEATNALEKVQCREEKDWMPLHQISALKGERIAFQIAVKSESPFFADCRCAPEMPFADQTRIRFVESVPCYHPSAANDTYVLTHRPSLLPDPLEELTPLTRVSRGNWHAFFIDIKIPEDAAPGEYALEFIVTASTETRVVCSSGNASLRLRVVAATMPKRQDLRFSNWFYADCVFKQHKTECWSEKHWHLLFNYFRNFAAHGSNMLLTPLWSLSLGVEKGKTRPTCQLLIIRDTGTDYEFDFSRLERWIDLANEAGVETFEMSHAYSQWGATASPHIIVLNPDGVEEAYFGWHVPADSDKYKKFLTALMPRLLEFLRKKGLEKRCYFHISDEPDNSNIASYAAAANFFTPLAEEFPIIDALSHIQIFKQGLIRYPIPSTASLLSFLKEEISERWTYYCGGVGCMPNRYIGLPSLRNRIIGLMLFFYDLNGGFLHWGYNAHYTRQSWSFDIDPYRETDWGRAGSSGCGFLVYPGQDGPVDSIRHEVFFDAAQDYRALRLLESKAGRQRVMEIIKDSLPMGHELALNDYPRDNSWLLGLRDKINEELGELETDC